MRHAFERWSVGAPPGGARTMAAADAVIGPSDGDASAPLQALIELGLTRGFLTRGDIVDALPQHAADDAPIAAATVTLRELGIAVREAAATQAAWAPERHFANADAVSGRMMLRRSRGGVVHRSRRFACPRARDVLAEPARGGIAESLTRSPACRCRSGNGTPIVSTPVSLYPEQHHEIRRHLHPCYHAVDRARANRQDALCRRARIADRGRPYERVDGPRVPRDGLPCIEDQDDALPAATCIPSIQTFELST
ncbi:hypothetical protein OKW30_002270 [Paraburkholderia sp. Clong3]